ncbi:MAG TPA: class I SAM-dependent methyltransferase [Allosphingosinicella sp.]
MARQEARARRAERALERQLDYQRAKQKGLAGRALDLVAGAELRSRRLRARLSELKPIGDDSRVLEVGSGAHGHIFFFGVKDGVGVDPLADHYRDLFPQWQGRARTLAVGGEDLPFPDSSFDVVISDNVVDHALDPRRIVEQIARVLAPGGLLYFTVNVHHPFYNAVARGLDSVRAAGLPLEIGPFADHTVHLTPEAAARLFDGLPFERISEGADIGKAKQTARSRAPRHPGDLLKRLFYKNAVYELIARRI